MVVYNMAVYPEKQPLLNGNQKKEVLHYFDAHHSAYKWGRKSSGLPHTTIKDQAGKIWIKSSHIDNGYHRRNPKHVDVTAFSGLGGYFGRINSVQNLNNSNESGVLKKQTSKRTPPELIENQIKALRALGRLRGFQNHQIPGGETVYLTVMKFAKGTSLYDMLYHHDVSLTEHQLLRIVCNLIKEVERIHKSGRVHGDIKLEHIIVDPSNLSVELVDFDLAYEFDDPISQSTKVLDEIRGTEEYLAPELKEHRIYSNKTDIFALGKIMKILAKHYSSPATLYTLGRWMTATFPALRPDIEDILSQVNAMAGDLSLLQQRHPSSLSSSVISSRMF